MVLGKVKRECGTNCRYGFLCKKSKGRIMAIACWRDKEGISFVMKLC